MISPVFFHCCKKNVSLIYNIFFPFFCRYCHTACHLRSSESTVSYSSASVFPTSHYEYVIDIITLYKGEPDVVYDQQISFVTRTSSAACGIAPEIDGEYLFGLNRIVDPSDSTDEGELWASLCYLFTAWSNVDEDELDGCTSDACEGACDEFEVLHALSSDWKQSF